MNGLRKAKDQELPQYGICVQEIFEVYFPSTMHTIEFVVSSKPMTFQDAQNWCLDLGSVEKTFEIITPYSPEEEEYFLNFAENFWIGLGTKSEEIKNSYGLYEMTEQNLE